MSVVETCINLLVMDGALCPKRILHLLLSGFQLSCVFLCAADLIMLLLLCLSGVDISCDRPSPT